MIIIFKSLFLYKYYFNNHTRIAFSVTTGHLGDYFKVQRINHTRTPFQLRNFKCQLPWCSLQKKSMHKYSNYCSRNISKYVFCQQRRTLVTQILASVKQS